MKRGAWTIATLFALAGSCGATEALAPGVALLHGRFVSGAQPDGNSVLIHADEGVIVFDAGRHPAHAEALLAALAAAKPSAVALVNSHWHLDHSGGLIRLRAAYPAAQLHASAAIETARQGFLANYRAQLQQFAAQPVAGGPSAAVIRSETALIDGSAAMQPDVVVDASHEKVLLGRRLKLGLGSGVSGGDVWLLDPTSGVLLAGDLVTQPAPLFDTACAARWSQDLAALAEEDFVLLVPGHGAAMDRAAFTAWRHGFDALVACATAARPATECRDGWMQGPAAALSTADRALAGQLLDYYLGGPLTAEAQQRQCATAQAD